jgi:hypothetical protein
MAAGDSPKFWQIAHRHSVRLPPSGNRHEFRLKLQNKSSTDDRYLLAGRQCRREFWPQCGNSVPIHGLISLM